MRRVGVEALLVTDVDNVFYLTGFTGSTAAAIVTETDAHILVDPRYSIQARAECAHSRVHDYTGKATITAASELANDLKPAVLGYEADNLTVVLFRALRKSLDKGIGMRSTSGVVAGLRSVKDETELALIRKAAAIVDRTYDVILSEIRPGVSEKQLALAVDSTMRRLGADKEGFDTIAAAGPNSACPHASPTDALIGPSQFVKLDFGARYRRYNSDITRTVCVGEPTSQHREVYQVVLDAQMKAIEAIAPGKPGREIDAVARDYIASMGYGPNFGHGLGHAIGIQVHDGPAFSVTSDVVLQPGMVMTVEPGIYIEGWGGVRIEDDIVVTESGVEVITTAPKSFTCL